MNIVIKCIITIILSLIPAIYVFFSEYIQSQIYNKLII